MPAMEIPRHPPRVAGEPLVRVRDSIPYALALGAVAAFSFLSGGYVVGRSTPVAVAFLCAAAVWVWFLRRSTRPSPLFLAALVALAAFAAWSALSVLWSFGPDLTRIAFNLTAFYLAVVTVLGLTSARGLQVRVVVYGYLVVATAVGTYAFLGKAWPDVVTHAHTYARLDSPVGYWNVLALMMVMGICAALAVAGDRATPVAVRTVAAAAAVPMGLAFFFTFSRGGWLVLFAALALYFALTTTRLASFVSLVAVVAPLAWILWRLRGLETLFAATTDDSLRALEGGALLRWTAAALLITAGAQLAAALVQRGVSWPRWSVLVAGAVVVVVLVVVAGGGSARFVQQRGGASWVGQKLHALVTDAESEQGENAADRLFVFTSNGRIPLWREALAQSRVVRAAGTGAGTFAFTHYRFRQGGGIVKHAHGQWFNVLSELGVVGLGLLVAATVLLVAAMMGNPFAQRRDRLHPLLVALQAGVVAFLIHMSWDWDWDMAAVGTAAFVFVAVGASYRTTRQADQRRHTEEHGGEEGVDAQPPGRWGRAGWGVRVVASAALLLVAASWLPPYFALRAQNAALAAAADGEVTVALGHAHRAATWDPLAVRPLLTEAMLLQQLGRNREAHVRLQTAARLQPQNYEVWYALGMLEHGVLGRDAAARSSFSRALALKPDDADSLYELRRLAQ